MNSKNINIDNIKIILIYFDYNKINYVLTCNSFCLKLIFLEILLVKDANI